MNFSSATGSDAAQSDATSPLRIIALFIAMSEALATAAAVATDGTARMMLTGFAVAFPFVVLAVFVWILIAHTAKLYAPHQYTRDTSIGDFVKATQRQTRDAQLVLRGAVSQAVATAVAADSSAEPSSAASVREQIVATFDQAVDAASITLVRSLVIDDAESVKIPVRDETTVQELLDSAYFALAPAIDPYTYGVDWVLVRGDQEAMPNLGSSWAGRVKREGDDRRLSEVGIEAGMALTAIPRGHRSFRAR